MQKWEYWFLDVQPPKNLKAIQDIANQAGLDGWELIKVDEVPAIGPIVGLYFKRPLP